MNQLHSPGLRTPGPTAAPITMTALLTAAPAAMETATATWQLTAAQVSVCVRACVCSNLVVIVVYKDLILHSYKDSAKTFYHRHP